MSIFEGSYKLYAVILLSTVRNTNDDDVAYHRNRDELTKEMRREKPKKDVVLTLSRQTFLPRRADILSDSVDVCVSSLLSDFPELWKPYVVCI